jgi:xylose dehydrogenase (NAD/NADP)
MIYRVGIVGAGGISREHAQAIAQTDCAELVAVCDVSQETMEKYCGEFDVRGGYTNLDEMLDKEKLDIAIICTWGRSHAELGNQIAKSQRVRAILCEKPITQTAAECEEMVATAKENGVLLAEAFKFRHHPLHLKTREIIDSGQIGSLCNIRSTFCVGIPEEYRDPAYNWRFNKEKGGGAVYDLGCYNIHHARFIAGSDPVSVYATGEYGREIDDTVCAVLTFPNQVTAQLTFSFKAAGSQYFEVSGTDGILYTELAWNNENRATTLEVQTRDGNETHEFEPVFQFQNQIEHLCKCLDTGQAHRIPSENSIGNMKTIDAINESMHTGQVVTLG